MRAAFIASLSLVIIQVLGVGIPFRHPVHSVGFVNIPSHEVDGIGEVGALGSFVTGGLQVFFPRPIQGLGVAVGRTDATVWYKAKDVLARGAGVMSET